MKQYRWREEFKKFQEGWPRRKPDGSGPRRPSSPSGRSDEDDVEIDWLEDRLDRMERRCRRSELERLRLKESIAILRVRNEKMYVEGRRPEEHDRLISMLNENHPGTEFH